MQGVLEHGCHLRAARQQAFLGIGVQRAECRRACQGVRRIGVAVQELDEVLGSGHEGVVDVRLDEHRAHRYAAVRDALGHRHEVGRHAEVRCRER